MTRNSITPFTVILLALTPMSHAINLPGNVEWGESIAAAVEKLATYCSAVRTIAVQPPSFPLATSKEEHIICRGFRSGEATIDAIAFVFGDDKLIMLEARGGAVAALGAIDSANLRNYMHYEVSDNSERFVDKNADAVWFLSSSALHPNLFTWSNPHLDATDEPAKAYNLSAVAPTMLAFGSTLDELRKSFVANCALLIIEANQQIWLPHEPSSQTQVNCFGFEYAGFPRKIEAVFGDGVLEVVWILTGKPEEDRVREALVAAFGKGATVNENWEVFAGNRVALRKDKPEVLMISERMLPYYVTNFE